MNFDTEEERMFAELLLREDEDRRFLSGGMSMDTSCDYDIDVQVPSIIPLGEYTNQERGPDRGIYLTPFNWNFVSTGCIPPASENSSTNCGIVRSSVVVSAPQLLEPFEADLRRNLTEALRLAIDGEAFESFFPADCII